MTIKPNDNCQNCKYSGNSVTQILGTFMIICELDDEQHRAYSKHCLNYEPKEQPNDNQA